MDVSKVVQDLLLIVLAGAVSGLLCKRWGISLLVGYLLVGSVIGRGGLALVANPGHELEMIAEVGALLLLFSVGLEFSVDELARLGRFFLIGGGLQMSAVALPLILVARLSGMSMPGAILAGSAGSFSSTVLVFRALAEEGQTESPHGRRGIAVLLFQDAALVPLLLLVPLMTGAATHPMVTDYLMLLAKASGFLLGVWALQQLIARFLVAILASARSVELIVLSTIALLLSLCWLAYHLALPPAVAAFAAGLVLSGNRLSKQIDTIILPFRETFAAVFFVSLGMLLRPAAFLAEPLLLITGLVGMLMLKSCGAAVALRAVGLPWRSAFGMGLGLSQLGEFSFLLVSRGVSAQIIDTENYNRMLFIAVATLILTPWLLRAGLKWAGPASDTGDAIHHATESGIVSALVIGIGPIGGQIASRLETIGVELAMIDLSPVNLHPFAQLGFVTFAGDGRDADVLARARIAERDLAVVCVPQDDLALEIVKALHRANPAVSIIVRCRYQLFAHKLRKAGAMIVVSEEQEAFGPLMQQCERWFADRAAFKRELA